MKKLTRRSFMAFLSLLPSAARATIRAQQPLRDNDEPPRHHRWRQLVDTVIGPYQSVVIVGRRCGQSSPLTGLSPWTGHFFDKLNGSVNTPDSETLSSLRERYQWRVREDFHHGRTTRINGYILSQTEVEMCCLVNAMEDNQGKTI